ncbi:MAG: methyl-accepting chemotaxis protein [Candidatus Tectomicrobia bacterium]|uniref:Methyl-accepting chemotaxis protein n=1 Tax=Tectimicrobiota bacterium TaxID=2528274 RepID=A0A937W6L7_UNCTE|nr:methyl-accepting chemotaxis protein [Candidatus Tectomicrobia bacterium]
MLQSLQTRLVLSVTLSALVVLGLSIFCMAYTGNLMVALLLIGIGTAVLAGVTAMSCQQTWLAPLQTLLTAYEQTRTGRRELEVIAPEARNLVALVTGYQQIVEHVSRQLRSTQAERDDVYSALQILLGEVDEVARGNLTVEVAATAPATEALATAFNTMIRHLRTVVGHMQDAVLQVSTAAHAIQTTAEHLAQGSSTQVSQIVGSSAALEEMAVSIQDVSAHATLSATVAEQALANARQGAQAVHNTIAGMQRIHTQVQETAGRITQLGERSQDITATVQLIGDIADRTSVLALNASIEAALAGEAGQGFAVVAQEVERLAQRATTATRQIASLVATMQHETAEATTAMHHSVQEVVQGSHLADQAGQALEEIEGVSELIRSISQAAQQQARGSESLSRAMEEIADITQQMAAGTSQAAVSIQNLALLADELRHTVSTFRLPVTTNGRRRGA